MLAALVSEEPRAAPLRKQKEKNTYEVKQAERVNAIFYV